MERGDQVSDRPAAELGHNPTFRQSLVLGSGYCEEEGWGGQDVRGL